MVKKIYQALKPGDYLEIGGLELSPGCDDDSVPRDSYPWQWHSLLQEAGFVDITRKDYIWPLNSWPADSHL
ncbi:secondary metabolism regulator LAE1 [Colletotrichum spaethianum]|uniref:Secondary metabolism regulator LAE1 n=1 Tax=Colletotrichum spaethianum TaxID=700344 RepID=A0AA37LC65_9PEZI|nr:secondary metabolism regulator LAE1 [Colletotrichum spaethianum]GKT45797.1 secondary metabolism regulator LAE1 [Colletotrichum spaethianum]